MDNPLINKKSKRKSLNKPLNHSSKNILTASKLLQKIEKIEINTELMQLEMPLSYIKKTNNNLTSASLFQTHQGGIIGLANYHQKGRIATMGSRELFELSLSKNSSDTPLGRVMFNLFSWLIGKPRIPRENEKSYILNLAHQFFTNPDKSPLDESHNLYIDNFDSPHQWEDGVIQSAQQIEDALLPTGQWHRHYSCILLPANANDLQVKLIRRWLKEMGGSLVIIFDQTITPSKYIIELLKENHLTIQSEALPSPRKIKPNGKKIELAGLSLKVSSLNQLSSFSATQLIVSQLNFRQSPVKIKNNLEPLLWLYKGFIELPEEGMFILGADTEKNDQIIIYLGEQEIKLDKNNNFQSIKHKNFIPKSKIPINIKVKTIGKPPSLRLFWRRPNSTKYELLPKNALSHAITTLAKSRKPRHVMPKSTPVIEALSQHPFHQVVKLPEIYTKQLLITDDIAAKADSFTIKIKNKDHYIIVDIHDVKLTKVTSGKDLARELELSIKKNLPKSYDFQVKYLNNKIKINFSNNSYLDRLVIYHYPKKHLKILKTPYKIRNLANKIIYDINFNFSNDEIKKISHFSLQFSDSKSIDFNQTSLFNKDQFLTPKLFATYLQRYIHYFSKEDSIKVTWNEEEKLLHIEDHQLRKLKTVNFAHYDHPLPLIYAQPNENRSNSLVIGAIQGELPFQQQTLSYNLLEAPQFGNVTWNKQTGEWSYQPYSNEVFKGFDQFHFQAIGKDGVELPPISISLQSERPPVISIPGKKIFTIADPIYTEPPLRYHPIPSDMKIHDIYLAQTHLLKPDDPYLSLAAKRWVLIKVNATSQSLANSPDFIAIIKNKDGNELGRVVLQGADNLPSTLTDKPEAAEISRQVYDANSYSAPIKSAWIKPGIQIQLIADNKPIIMPYTDQTGHFSPNVQLDQHTISRLWNHSYYQPLQGIYPYSMLSWGQEALAKLAISQFTLYSHPTDTIEPTLFKIDTPLMHPAYDNINAIPEQQNSHTHHHSFMSQTANGLQKEMTYTSRYSKYKNSTIGLGSVGAGYGSGIAASGVLWHESFGHGLSFNHTTGKNYPYDNQSNGPNFAFDQINDVYLTHHYADPQSEQYKPMLPSMYPSHSDDGKLSYAAFKPHSDYHTYKANKYFIEQLRWQPNAIHGIDSEDNGFAGQGYYQHWDLENKEWITLSAKNFHQFYSPEEIYNLAHQRDVPVYWLSGSFIQYNGRRLVPNSELYPLSQLNVTRTIGNLPADYYNFQTNNKRPYNPYQRYALKVTYLTPSGLLTDTLQLPFHIELDQLSMNIPDKGELVSVELIETQKQKKHSNSIYTYLNSDELANTVFSKISSTDCLTLPNYWLGNKLFWAITDQQLIDKSTGKVDYKKVRSNSAIKASWIKKGKYHQQIFSLNNMDIPIDLSKVSLSFYPLNHHEQLYRNNKQRTIHYQNVLTESQLISGTHINEYIDITASPQPKNTLYWVKLLWSDANGNLTETDPLEPWYIYQQNNKLIINGVVDSTPEIELAGLRIYSDLHLLDQHAATSITLYQKTFFERDLFAQTKEQQRYQSAKLFAPLYERTELFDMRKQTEGEMGVQTHQLSMTSPLSVPTLAVN